MSDKFSEAHIDKTEFGLQLNAKLPRAGLGVGKELGQSFAAVLEDARAVIQQLKQERDDLQERINHSEDNP